MAYRPTLRQDAIRWLRERPTQLYVDLLTEAHAAVAINPIVLVLVSGTAGGLIYPWPVWVAGPAGAALLAVSAGAAGSGVAAGLARNTPPSGKG